MTKQEIIERYGVEEYQRRLAKAREWRQDHKKEKAEYDKRYNLAHKEEIAEKNKQYYQTHKEEIAENQKQYRLEHKEELAEKKKKYCLTHKKEKAEYDKQLRNTPMGRAKKLLHRYNRSDRIANRDKGDLTPDWIIDNILNVGKCHYCGRELPFTELGCDRKDSTLPHTKDNCVPCCFDCNRKKWAKSYDEYKNK